MKTFDWKAVERKLNNMAKKFVKEAYGIELVIPVRVNGRLKSAHGMFRYYANTKKKHPLFIDISKTYIEYQDWKLVESTLKHECIHYALYMLGKPFKDGHPVFEGEIVKHGSHSTQTVPYRGKVVVYGCPKCKQEWQKKRKYPNNGKGYRCPECKEQIVFLGERIKK